MELSVSEKILHTDFYNSKFNPDFVFLRLESDLIRLIYLIFFKKASMTCSMKRFTTDF